MGRIKILGCAYRLWAIKILDFIRLELNTDITIIRDNENVTIEKLEEINPDIILFYGWSWRVPSEIINKYLCLCLHPSPLPKYRGGSPIQNQIMNSEINSAVSIFKMTDEMDAGDLCGQEPFSLEGQLYDILNRITNVGGFMSVRILRNFQQGILEFKPQQGEPTIFSRRKLEESEVTQEELKYAPSRYLYNKIRCLQDPYPNAFITCSDGEKLLIKEAVCGE